MDAWMEESMYGKRDGHVSGLAIMSKDQRNLFRGTRGHKTGTILGIDMCPRQDMWKPQAGLVKKWLTMKGIVESFREVLCNPPGYVEKTLLFCLCHLFVLLRAKVTPARNWNLPHLGRAMTDVQELRQAAWYDSRIQLDFIEFPKFWGSTQQRLQLEPVSSGRAWKFSDHQLAAQQSWWTWMAMMDGQLWLAWRSLIHWNTIQKLACYIMLLLSSWQLFFNHADCWFPVPSTF